MSLTDSRIGPYEIGALIGAGGMGEVYRARDTRLGRDVALKVLPDAFAGDEDRLGRFRREAHLLASLNHPNIAAIYGLEESGGVHALALELVEGPTLADRVAGGPLPFDEALPIARQIVDALEAAHEQGIIHRDLKPANIKVREDGTVKVLDFGLAKALEGQPAAAGAGISMSPTMSVHATYAGVILGTAAYMSPEQARGKPVDKRTDVWAFGCVLYEMLTGARAFEGDEITDILAAIVRAEPAFSKLPPDTPSAIRRLLTRCLEKDRRERLPDIGTARLEIKEALGGARAALMAPARASSRFAPRRMAWFAAAIVAAVAAGAVAVGIVMARRPPPPAAIVRFQVAPPAGGSFIVGANGPAMAVSPDGTQLAFVASTQDGKPDLLYVRRIDATEAVSLPGTENALNPFWSPDGRTIAFFAGTQLKKIDLSGGPPQVICATPSGLPAAGVSAGAWSREGVILFNATGGQVLHRVNASGGVPTLATALNASREELGHYWPRFLPDGRRFLYWVNSASEEHRGVYVGVLGAHDARQLVATEYAGDFASPNQLLFRRGGTLFSQTVAPGSFELEGEPVRIADPVGSLTNLGRPGFSVSETGVLAFWPISGLSSGTSELTVYDRTGKVLTSLGGALYRGIRLSPDGRRLATHVEEGVGGDIWVMDLERGSRQRLTFNPEQHNGAPIWSPDGRQIAFSSIRNGKWGVYRKAANGTGPDELLVESSGAPKAPESYAPDGRTLIFSSVDPKTLGDLWMLRLGNGATAAPYMQSPFRESKAAISPDGRWLAYESNESGRAEIYVQSLSSNPSKWQVSTAGGLEPIWRKDGREVFFISSIPGRMFAADVEPSADGLRFGIPRELFQFAERNPGHVTPFFRYAVSPDGQRVFVAHVPAAAEAVDAPLTVVLNWTSLLQRD